MNRILPVIAVAVMFGGVNASPPRSPASDDPPRNLVWISIEDLSPWLGCYGDETVSTPNLDRIAAEGVRYVNAFATTPVCAPSRSTLITGC